MYYTKMNINRPEANKMHRPMYRRQTLLLEWVGIAVLTGTAVFWVFEYEKYGSPDVLEMKQVEKPSPKENEVMRLL